MTLTTHALVGAAVASFIPEYPALALIAAFGSHFLIDAIPHGDYEIYSASIHPKKGAPITLDKNFFLDAVRIGADALIGVALSLLLFAYLGHPLLIFFAACAGILPDPLQFVYAHFKHEPLVSLQHFHQWIHTQFRLKGRPGLAILSQTAFALVVVLGALYVLA